MSGRNVDAPCTLIKRDEVPEQDRRQSGRQRTLRLQSLESFIPLFCAQDCISRKRTSLRHGLDQWFGDDEHLRADFHEGIFDIGMKADRLICGKGPWSR